MSIVDILLNPNGRISRLTFWTALVSLTAILLALIYGILRLSGDHPGAENLPLMLTLLLAVPLLWIGFCLLAKRWHDRGRSVWWLLLPVLGQVWALVECALFAGARSGNKYGPSPYGTARVMAADEDIPEDMA